MKKITVFVLLSMFIFLLAGCNMFDQSGNVTGKVTDKTGAAISGVEVTIGTFKVTTNQQGMFTVNDIKAGTYTAVAKKVGYVESSQSIVVEKGKTITANFVLDKTGAVTGKVTYDSTELGLGNVTVTIDTKTAVTDANGVYSLNYLQAGTYNVSVQVEGFSAYTGSVTVESDKVSTLDITLTPSVPMAMFTGYVTDGRGGPVVSGATVNNQKISVITDAKGYFQLPIAANVSQDIFVEKTNRGTVRIQSLSLAEGETMEIDVPTRAAFNPNASFVPPVITVTGVKAGDELTGQVTFDLAIQGSHDIFVYYVYVGGEQRFPNSGFATDTATGKATFDSSLVPNGPTFIKVLAYDNHDNAVLMYIPVTINNVANDTVLPANVTVTNVVSTTFAQNFGYYSNPKANLLNGEVIDLRFTEDTTVRNSITWTGVTGADGYYVYRSFDQINWTKIGTIMSSLTKRYDDYSSQLAPGKKTYYKVVSYNSFGVGEGMIVWVTPLPVYNVNLVSPAHEATNVSLTPTFTWERIFPYSPENPAPETIADGFWFTEKFELWDNTGSKLADVTLEDKTEIALAGQLNPGGVYTWDIYEGTCYAYYRYDASGYSASLSVLDGRQVGSLNGKFMFTTTTTLGQ